MPDWVQHAIWWQVYPLGFLGADPSGLDREPARRLDRIADWLDYAVELGVSGLALGPVFAASTHGYDTVDYHRIDPRLGDEADFRALVDAAHDRGLRVLLDGVFNHVGRDFPQFQETLRSGTDDGWFRRDGAEFATFEGHPGLIALDHRNPAVADFVVEVMCHWLGVGADGWRLDVAYAVPVEFWAAVLGRVREKYPRAYFFGEVIHGDYKVFIAEGGLDSVTQYEMWKATWSSLNDRNFFELAWAMDRHNGYLESFAPLTFVGNHDVTRIASALTDERHLPHALVVLLTTGGTPSIYYGDEQAFRGVKEDRAGGDDAVRPTFPADGPGALAPDGWPVYRLHQRLIGLRRRHSWLHRARTTKLELSNTRLVYETAAGDNRLIVALSLEDDAANLAVPGATEVLD
ncbi:MAG TPA: alpha-amylase family protein, partial [Mycobacteriales bacterium]|nr:alpha-amylase family protein [Mycobacteriales bacterium]